MSPPAAAVYSTRSSKSAQPPRSGSELLRAALDALEQLPSAQALIKSIEHQRRNTRPGYPPNVMFRAICLKYLLGERFTVGLIEQLNRSASLRQVCGFTGDIPSEPTFSRFFKLLTGALDDRYIAEMVETLKQELPDLGNNVAVDSTDIETFANPDRTPISDTDAAWGHRTTKAKSNGKNETEPFFGYKMHALNDAVYGAPLVHMVLPANEGDSPQLPKLVEKAQRTHSWLKPKHLLADRGYDSNANHTSLVRRSIIPIIHIRRNPNGLSGGVYHTSGVPVCADGKARMVYTGTDQRTGRHAFRCPPAGCKLKSKSSGAMLYCDPTPHWEDPMNNLRVLGIVARASPQWRVLYKKRPTIERLFGSMKRTRLLDKHQYRGQRKIEAHVTLSVLTYLATMLVRAQAGDMKRLRHMRIRQGGRANDPKKRTNRRYASRQGLRGLLGNRVKAV